MSEEEKINTVENQILSNDSDKVEQQSNCDDKSVVSDDSGAGENEKIKVETSKKETGVNPVISRIVPRPMYREIPKVNYKKNDDDIEEFDSDDEEEIKAKQQSNYTENISYEGDRCIYTEPGTGRKLIWNNTTNNWSPKEENSSAMENYQFDGKNYMYKDKNTNVTYKFLPEKNEWVVSNDVDKNTATDDKNVPKEPPVQGVYGFENDTHIYTDPSDNMSYFWDKEKNAWFPKVDDDFMAKYQMSYGFIDSSQIKAPEKSNEVSKNSIKPDKPKLSKEERKAENKRKAQEAPTWFEMDQKHNLSIYISNLPLDVTMDELKELVCKCGLLARDDKGVDKIKLYTDENGDLKGDARCTYIKVESVNLALNILDGWDIRGNVLGVQRAEFKLKGEYDPSKKPKKKKKDKEKQKKIHEKLLDWRPDKMLGEPLKCERVVILKNLFQPEDFDKDPKLILEFSDDIRSECVKCGEVKKIVLYDSNPEGVAQVSFKEVEEAQACIELLNGRWFGQRRITAETWDGRTKYKIKETEEEIEARIKKWDDYLEDESSESKTKTSTSDQNLTSSSKTLTTDAV